MLLERLISEALPQTILPWNIFTVDMANEISFHEAPTSLSSLCYDWDLGTGDLGIEVI